MAFTHRVTYSYADERVTVTSIAEALTGTNAGVDISDQVSPGQTKYYEVMICPEYVQSMLMHSDQPMTIFTNDQTSPTNTINLKASVPLIWTINSFWPIPFQGGNVTKLFMQNAGAVPANVQIRVLSISES